MGRVRPYIHMGDNRINPFDGGAPRTLTGGGGGPGNQGAQVLVGSSTEPPTMAEWQANNVAMGPWTVRRSFSTEGFGMPASWSACPGGDDIDICASVYSCKPNPNDVASGALDNRIRGFINSIPDSHIAFVTIWHEADVKIKQGTAPYNANQYRAAWQRFFSIVREVNKPHVYTTCIFGEYVWKTPSAAANMDVLWPGNGSDGRPLCDVYGIDPYVYTPTTQTPASMVGGLVDFARSKGIGWGIGELGASSSATNGPDLADWMQEFADYCEETGAGPHPSCAYLCWFNATTGGVPEFPNAFPETRAKSKEISQQLFTPYTSFVL